jgi:hypothetical protein
MGSVSQIATLLFVGAAMWPRSATAQVAPGHAPRPGPAPAPALTPPVAQDSTDVPYPKGASLLAAHRCRPPRREVMTSESFALRSTSFGVHAMQAADDVG